MDAHQFDGLTRLLASSRSRRNLLRLLAANAVAALVAGGKRATAADCLKAGKPCSGDAKCCSGACRQGTCVAAARSADRQGARCLAKDKACKRDGDCCSGDCDKRTGVCGGNDVRRQQAAATICLETGATCAQGADCCSGTCSARTRQCTCLAVKNICNPATPQQCCSGRCPNGRCGRDCTADVDCGADRHCCNGVCRSCCDASHCAGGQTCQGGTCGCPDGQIDCAGTCQQCCADGDCASGETCQGGTCTAVGCPAGQIDCNGTCWQCCADGDCPAGQTCQAGTCAGGCPAGQRDCNGVCQECCNDGDCGAGRACRQGTCAAGCPAGQRDCGGTCRQCCADGDCGAAERCRQGICEPTCPAGQRDCDGVCQDCCLDGHCGSGERCRQGTCAPDAPAVLVRRSVHALAPNGPELTAFARGVGVMKTRPASDPTSWTYQADMHGTIGQRCQHGTFFFLSWHRMYLYWFERILRAAAGDATLTVPYWNYADPEQRVMPAPFRLPAAASNPLYVAERSAAVNAGQPPTAAQNSIFDHSQAFAATNFFHTVAGEVSFGGRRVAAPTHLGGNRGLLEAAPHGGVHNWIGGRLPNGQPGWMATVLMSAHDPIFWLHHSNIDRLWKRWLELGGGRANPTDNGDWMNDQFTFWDENGAAVTMTGQAIIDSVEQLGYRYDDDGEGGAARRIAADGTGGEPAPAETVIGTVAKRLSLGPEAVAVPIPLKEPKAGDGTIADARGGQSRVVLTVDGIQGAGVAGVGYEVYVDLPAGATPNPDRDAFVGSISLFGLQPWDAAHGANGHGAPTATQSFDITGKVAANGERGGAGQVTVTFLPIDLAGGAGAPAAPPGTWASIQQLTIKASGSGGGGSTPPVQPPKPPKKRTDDDRRDKKAEPPADPKRPTGDRKEPSRHHHPEKNAEDDKNDKKDKKDKDQKGEKKA